MDFVVNYCQNYLDCVFIDILSQLIPENK